jgi:site-specific DNA-methyltransferase (cytosine-N4-specific)
MTVRIIQGDCRAELAKMAAGSVHCVVTSPPYFGLRDYKVAGQIGLEPTLGEYITEMVAVLRAVRRVLRRDGTCWINMGDSYAGSSGAQPGRKTPSGTALKQKDLMLVPARLAIALQADGWWLRKDIIWAKPNPMPESATDRPTSSHEHVLLLTKAQRYFYDADAVREGRSGDEDANTFRGDSYIDGLPSKRAVTGNHKVKVPGGWDQGDGGHGTVHRDGRTAATYQAAEIKAGRNLRDVWTIAPHPFPEAHFATFPPRLAELCILAGTSARGCCPACGKPWVRVVAKGDADLERQRACGGDADGAYHGRSTKDHATAGVQDASAVKARILAGMVKRETAGWRQACACPDHEPAPCVVLDPFGGAGTTGLVAERLQRDAVLIELNPEYVAMATARIRRDGPLFNPVAAA